MSARRVGRRTAANYSDREAEYVCSMVLAVLQEIQRQTAALTRHRHVAMKQLADRHPTELAQIMVDLHAMERAS